MRNILCAATAFLFLTSFVHGAEGERVQTFELFPNQFYVFLLSNSIVDPDDDPTLHDGMEFPLYVGYVVVKDNTFTFVKKTPLPLENLVYFLDRTKASFTAGPHNRNSKPRLSLSTHLHAYIPRLFRNAFLVGFTGEPDENYTPVFEKTCVYRANPKKTCTSREFDIPPEYFLIPTSNVTKERIGRRLGPEREARIERYDPETKTWEDIGWY